MPNDQFNSASEDSILTCHLLDGVLKYFFENSTMLILVHHLLTLTILASKLTATKLSNSQLEKIRSGKTSSKSENHSLQHPKPVNLASAKSISGEYNHKFGNENDCSLEKLQKLGGEVLTKILDKYDQNIMPNAKGVDVEIELIMQTVTEISEISYSFKSDLLFSQIWHDPALRFDYITRCFTNLTLSHKMIDKLWVPNVCFINSKKTEVHYSPTPNIFLLIFPNGTVWTNYRVAIQAPCIMDFTAFPMDRALCELMFESYSFNVGKVDKI
uniref:Neurotransmitter-gated ion-channel ligand-binding domain-containing protein n=1 Tax=Romanomermis culicivorax TaxID=13658 RepID=A0A915J2T7_ROMCU